MKKNVLHLTDNPGYGGVQQFIINSTKSLINDCDISICFLSNVKVESISRFFLAKKLYFTNYSFLKFCFVIFRNNFDVVHIHLNFRSLPYLIISKMFFVPCVIVHSHNSYPERRFFYRLLKYFASYILFALSDNAVACSRGAGKWLYNNNGFIVVNNAVDMQTFKYNENVRNNLRYRYGVAGKFIIGQIGSLSIQKNPIASLNILKIIIDNYKSNVMLVYVGAGVLKNEILFRAKELGILDSVMIINETDEPNSYYSFFDSLVMPSLYEGLPLVLIEAQFANLKCFVSKNVTEDSNISKTIQFLDFNDELDCAKSIDNYFNSLKPSRNATVSYGDGYNIESLRESLLYVYNSR